MNEYQNMNKHFDNFLSDGINTPGKITMLRSGKIGKTCPSLTSTSDDRSSSEMIGNTSADSIMPSLKKLSKCLFIFWYSLIIPAKLAKNNYIAGL